MFRYGSILIIHAVLLLPSTGVIAAPAELHGKSIVVSWTEDRMQRHPDQSEIRHAIRQGGFSVYVSSAGHIFNRLSMAKRGSSGSADRVGDTANRSVVFQGRTMTATQKGTVGGARRIFVTFDESFGSCSAEVIRGKEEGSTKIVAHSLIRPGETVEIYSVHTSGASCSVKNGNVFGGE